MKQEQGKCISIKDVPYSLDKSMIFLEKGKIVDYLQNRKNGYYFVSNGKDDYHVLMDDEFKEYFKLLDDFRNQKIDDIL